MSYSEIVINEIFGFGKKKKQENYFASLTKDECNTLLKIGKQCIDKYPKLKKLANTDNFNDTVSDHVSKTKVNDDDYINIFSGDLWDYPGFSRDDMEPASNDVEKFCISFNEKIKESNIKAKVVNNGDWDDFDIDVVSRKSLNSSKNESSIEYLDESEHIKRQFMPETHGLKDTVKTMKSELIDKPKDSHKYLSDLEYSYDKKFNAFCLTVSGYSTEKLESTLAKKKEELEDAKNEKKAAYTIDRASKLAIQLKIDYLNNVCNKLTAMIKKKKSLQD